MKKGFSLLTAIIFLLLIATISAISLSLSTQSVKLTSDLLLRSQAELLLRSGTEYALLAMSGYSDYNNSKCLKKVDMTYNDMFDINVSIMYIGRGIVCDDASPSHHILANDINTSDSNRTVIIDAYVRAKEGITSEPLCLHRRTIQKP